MKRQVSAIIGMALSLGACTAPVSVIDKADDKTDKPAVPEAVIRLAAPNQNVYSARLQSDGCYWYEYSGPVETTLLPLVTADGKRICSPEGSDETTPGYSI